MRRASLRQRSKGKPQVRSASLKLTDLINRQYSQRIPVAALIGVSKMYGRGKVQKTDRILKRLSVGDGQISTKKLVQYLSKPQHYELGKPLTAGAIERVYNNFANEDGNLSFEYIMKMSENSGVTINQRMAKAIVRKFGQRKDHLTLADCQRINQRHQRRLQAKSTSRGKR